MPEACAPMAAADVLDGRFRLEETLKLVPGRLGVYRARDEATGEAVKVKWVPSPAEPHWERRELAILADLRHPLVPRPIAVVERPDGVAFVQTYLVGPTLREVLKAQGPLPAPAVVAILASALELLIHLHEAAGGVIHRDVKPANMVGLATGEVALIDFGIARLGTRPRTPATFKDLTRAHTAGYAPPEQMIGLEARPVADTYALGASAMYLLTDQHPTLLWDADRGRLVPPPAVDTELAALLGWLTAPAVAERCPSARAALAAVERLP